MRKQITLQDQASTNTTETDSERRADIETDADTHKRTHKSTWPVPPATVFERGLRVFKTRTIHARTHTHTPALARAHALCFSVTRACVALSLIPRPCCQPQPSLQAVSSEVVKSTPSPWKRTRESLNQCQFQSAFSGLEVKRMSISVGFSTAHSLIHTYMLRCLCVRKNEQCDRTFSHTNVALPVCRPAASLTERAMNKEDRNSARVKRGRGGGRAGEGRKDKYAKSYIRYKCIKRTKYSKCVGRLIFVHLNVCMYLFTHACMNE